MFGINKFHFIGLVSLVLWLTYLKKTIPKCPKCGLGLFSIIEIFRIPILGKSWVGTHCSGCGTKLSNKT